MIDYDDVVFKLMAMGYELQEADEYIIDQVIIETEQYIMNYCNIYDIPPELKYTALNMCCGNFLKLKLSMGELEDFNIENAVSSIQEGDVSVAFDDSTSRAELFERFVDALTDKEDELVCCRRMKW